MRAYIYVYIIDMFNIYLYFRGKGWAEVSDHPYTYISFNKYLNLCIEIHAYVSKYIVLIIIIIIIIIICREKGWAEVSDQA
jgi:hypothetical protein